MVLRLYHTNITLRIKSLFDLYKYSGDLKACILHHPECKTSPSDFGDIYDFYSISLFSNFIFRRKLSNQKYQEMPQVVGDSGFYRGSKDNATIFLSFILDDSRVIDIAEVEF